MKELDKDNFDEAVLAHKGLYLVDFWGSSCEECLAMMPEIEALATALEGQVEFGKVNIQGNRRLAMREKVLGVPTILIYKDGVKAATFTKEFTSEEIRSAVEELRLG
ncbi:MAG: thioredoxin family protein [Rectinemataceae bacterium]